MSQLSLTTSLLPPAQVSFRATGGGGILVDLNSGECFRLDEVGSRLWTHLSAGKTLEAAVVALHADYDVPRDTIETDALQLCRDLVAAGLLQEQVPKDGS